MTDGEYAVNVTTTSQGHKLKVCKEICSKAFENGRYEFSESAINVSFSNKTYTMMADFNLPRANFEDYVCDDTYPVVVDTKEIFNAVRNIKKNIPLSFKMLTNNPNRELIIARDVTCTKIKIQNVQSFRYKPPMTYDYPVVMKSSVYQQMCKDLNANKNNITFFIRNGNLVASNSNGVSTNDSILGIYRGPDTDYRETFKGVFFNYLNKLPTFSQQTKIYIGDKMPLRISGSVASLGTCDFYIKDQKMIQNKSSVDDENDDENENENDDTENFQ